MIIKCNLPILNEDDVELWTYYINSEHIEFICRLVRPFINSVIIQMEKNNIFAPFNSFEEVEEFLKKIIPYISNEIIEII